MRKKKQAGGDAIFFLFSTSKDAPKFYEVPVLNTTVVPRRVDVALQEAAADPCLHLALCAVGAVAADAPGVSLARGVALAADHLGVRKE